MSYIPLKVSLLSVHGVVESMTAMRLPKNNSKSDSSSESLGHNDANLAKKLILAGDSHAKALRGIVAWIELHMQVGFLIEFETYRHGVECLSTSSTMHNELQGLSGEALVVQKQRGLADKVYIRVITASYQALRRMYIQRRVHRHQDWRLFCTFIECLPYFDVLICPEAKNDKGHNKSF